MNSLYKMVLLNLILIIQIPIIKIQDQKITIYKNLDKNSNIKPSVVCSLDRDTFFLIYINEIALARVIFKKYQILIVEK